MFEGTVRGNLDPLEQYTDSEAWEVILSFSNFINLMSLNNYRSSTSMIKKKNKSNL